MQGSKKPEAPGAARPPHPAVTAQSETKYGRSSKAASDLTGAARAVAKKRKRDRRETGTETGTGEKPR